MHIVVCVKQVPNPEAAFSMFSVDEAAKRVVPAAGLQLVMSPFDEQGIEAALCIREAYPETRITVMSLGPASARNAIKHGLAMGADEGVLIGDSRLEAPDAFVTANVLAAAIGKLFDVDLVLAGRQSADTDAGIVGAALGERLGIPVVSYAKAVSVEAGIVRVERVLDDGTEVVEAALPAVVTVSNELGAPRTPNLRETMRAARKPVMTWSAADLALDDAALRPRGVRVGLHAPSKEGRCEFLPGSVKEQAASLAKVLHEASLL